MEAALTKHAQPFWEILLDMLDMKIFNKLYHRTPWDRCRSIVLCGELL